MSKNNRGSDNLKVSPCVLYQSMFEAMNDGSLLTWQGVLEQGQHYGHYYNSAYLTTLQSALKKRICFLVQRSFLGFLDILMDINDFLCKSWKTWVKIFHPLQWVGTNLEETHSYLWIEMFHHRTIRMTQNNLSWALPPKETQTTESLPPTLKHLHWCHFTC